MSHFDEEANQPASKALVIPPQKRFFSVDQSPQGNTYIFDPESPVELGRLMHQDRMLTRVMGGPLAGIDNPLKLHTIADLGCGAGGWVLETAFALPEAEVEGMDSSRTMVDYANARARSQQIFNASFGLMDLTQPLELPDACFDLVNSRLLLAVLQRDAWLPYVRECLRVLRPGGLLRLTEPAEFGSSNSAALNLFFSLCRRVLWQLGYGFCELPALGLIPRLSAMLREEGFQQVRLQAHALDYSFGTQAWADQVHNLEIAGFQMKSLFPEHGLLSASAAEDLYRQMLIHIQAPGFCGVTHLTTILGHKPSES